MTSGRLILYRLPRLHGLSRFLPSFTTCQHLSLVWIFQGQGHPSTRPKIDSTAINPYITPIGDKLRTSTFVSIFIGVD